MVIAIASQKGGTGKTSTSISLAAGVARKGKKTLLIDIDSQANASKVLLKNYAQLKAEQTIHATILQSKSLQIHPTEIPNLDIVPSHILLSNTDIELTTAIDHREARLKAKIEALKNIYDFVFIDCPYLEKRVKLPQELEELTPIPEDNLERAADMLMNFEKHWNACAGDVEEQNKLIALIVERVYVEGSRVTAMTLKADYHVVLGTNEKGSPIVSEPYCYTSGDDGIRTRDLCLDRAIC